MTMDAILSSTDPAWPANVTRSTDVDASCRACGKLLGRYRWVIVDAYWSGSVATAVAQAGATRATLEPGFVNARRRHPSGLPWLVRGRVPSRPSESTRLPVMVTCSCGVDNRLTRSQGPVWQIDRPFLSPET